MRRVTGKLEPGDLPAFDPKDPHEWIINVTCPRCLVPGDSTPISFPCCEHVAEARSALAELQAKYAQTEALLQAVQAERDLLRERFKAGAR